MILWRNIEILSIFIILIPTPDFPHFYYMLGGNLGSLMYGDVSVMTLCLFKDVTRINSCFESFTIFSRKIFRWCLTFDAVYTNDKEKISLYALEWRRFICSGGSLFSTVDC